MKIAVQGQPGQIVDETSPNSRITRENGIKDRAPAL
jgi:hypothetical protein